MQGHHDDDGVIRNLDDLSDTSDTHSPIYTKNQTGQQIAKLTFSAAFKAQDGSSKRQLVPTSPSTEKKYKTDHFKPADPTHLWFGFPTMEARAIEQGHGKCRPSHHNTKELATHLKICLEEAVELLNTRHAFPHVAQRSYPMERVDGKQGHFLHLTQLPKYTEVDEFGFERNNFQLTLWCDGEYKLPRGVIEDQITKRLQDMNIPLGDKVSPNLIVYSVDNMWLGLTKIHLANPQDGIDLLEGRRPLVIRLHEENAVILKVEKAFEIPTKGERLAIFAENPHLVGVTQEEITFQNIIESYNLGLDYEVLRSSKVPSKDFVHVFLANFASHTNMLKHGLKLRGNASLPVAPKKEKATRAQEQEQSDMDFALTLTVSQISRRDTQDEFSKAFTRLVSKPCVKALHFVGAKKWEKTAHTGKALFVCSNAVVYNKYLNKKSVACGRSFVDFNAHRRSIEGSMKPSKDILNKLGIGDIHKALANTLETMNISGTPPATVSTTFTMTPTTWKAELKALEDRVEKKMDSQEERLEKKITTTVTKKASAHLDKLYSKYANDLATQVSSLINERMTLLIKDNPTFEEASNNEDTTLALMDVMK